MNTKKQKPDTSFLKGMASQYAGNLTGLETVDVITFAQAPWGLNMELLPVQKFVLSAFYGLPLDNYNENIEVYDDINRKHLYTFSQSSFMDFLISEKRCNLRDYSPGKRFRELVLCVGRRGSKSTLASVVANYEVYRLIKMGNPQEHYGFPGGSEICITCVATSDSQAGVLFGMIRDKSLICEYVKERVVHSTQNYFDIQTDADVEMYGKRKKQSILVLCGGCSSVSLRGHNNAVVIMDEEAFFIDNDGRFSGDEVYRALTPSIATFVPKSASRGAGGDGKILNLSSPYGKYGIFWDNYNRSYEERDSMLMFQMYTSMLNPKADSVFLSSEKRRNPVTFTCEYGGEFSDRITSWMDNTEKFSACVNFEVTKNYHSGRPGIEYFMGVDVGLKNDGTGIAIVHKEKNLIVLDYADVWFSGSSDVWDYPDGIYKDCREYAGFDLIPVTSLVKKVKELNKWFPLKSGWFDQHQGYSLLQLLQDEGMNQFRAENVSAGMNTQIAQMVKLLIMEGMISMFDHPVLIKEMLSLQEEKKGNNLTVGAPPKAGAHDDISCAFLRAIWECYKANEGTSKQFSMSFSPGQGTGSTGAGGNMSAHLKTKIQMHGLHPRMLGMGKMNRARSMTHGYYQR